MRFDLGALGSRLRGIVSATSFIVLLFIGAFALGTFSYATLVCPPQNWSDAAYHALQLFGLNFLEATCPGKPLPLALQIARFAAALTLFATVLHLLSRTVAERLHLWWQTWSGGHDRVVLLGFGQINAAIARHLVATSAARSITVTARAFDAADRRFARQNGILLIEQDLTDAAALHRLHLGKCRLVVIACGDDTRNIEVGSAAAALCQTTGQDVQVHLASVQTLSAVRGRRDFGHLRTGRFDTFCIKDRSARQMLDQAQLPDTARRHQQNRVHLVLAGFGDMGEAIVHHAVLDACATGLGPPIVTVLDAHADTLLDRFHLLYHALRHPAFPQGDKVDLRLAKASVDHLDFRRPIILTDILTGADFALGNDVTAWAFASGDDDTNLRAGAMLEDAMQRGFRSRRPVFLRFWTARMAASRIAPRPRPAALQLARTFGAVNEGVAHLSFLTATPDQLPKAMHETYRQVFAQNVALPGFDQDSATPDGQRRWLEARQKFSAEWPNLPESVRQANRRLADHASIALADLGWDWRGREMGLLPRFGTVPYYDADPRSPAFWRQAQTPGSDAWNIMLAARSEHRRWMVERALAGWTPVTAASPQRDNLRLVHPNIVPFDALPPAPDKAPFEWDPRIFDSAMVFALLAELSLPDRARDTGLPMAGLRHVCRLHITPQGSATPILASPYTDLARPRMVEYHLDFDDVLTLGTKDGRPDIAQVITLPEQAFSALTGSIITLARRPAALRLVVTIHRPLPTETAAAPPPGKVSLRGALDSLDKALAAAEPDFTMLMVDAATPVAAP